MIMAAALPLAYNPDARRVANIGLGSGLTTHTFLADETIEQVDTIEIEPAMISRRAGLRRARRDAPLRIRAAAIHLEDAKTFFSQQHVAYDIIVAEPSNPWVSGVASLFSEEFYRSVRNYLTPDGIFVQWLQLYEFNDDLVMSVFKSLSQHFADYAIYNTDNTNILIVAKPDGRARDAVVRSHSSRRRSAPSSPASGSKAPPTSSFARPGSKGDHSTPCSRTPLRRPTRTTSRSSI